MRIKTAILFSLFLCAAFFFRMYGMSFIIPGSTVATHHRAISYKRDITVKKDGTETLHAGLGNKSFLKAKRFKKNKAVRCKRYRLSFPTFVQTAFFSASPVNASASAHAPPLTIHYSALPRYLSISILRI